MDIEYINNLHDSSVQELKLVDGELDNLKLDDKFNVIKLASNKIAHGGILCLSAIDALEVSRGMYRGYLTLQEFNSLLRPSLCTSNDVVALLASIDFDVQIIRVNNYRYYIEAQRP